MYSTTVVSYIDVAKKFLFTTYEVDGTNSAVQQAIMNNGVVEIFFYDESQPIYTTAPLNNTPFIYYENGGSFGQPSWYGGSSYTANTVNYFHSNTMDSLGTLSLSDTISSKGTMRSKAKFSKTMETGRVEQGGKSKTELKSVNIEFSPIYTSSVTWKIIPESEQPVQAGDLRAYCTGCGTRIKKSSWVFCPSCGNKL